MRLLILVLFFLTGIPFVEARVIRLKWPEDRQAIRYEIQISHYIVFDKRAKQYFSENPELNLELKEGSYFYIHRPLYAKGEGRWSVPRKIQFKVQPPLLEAPKDHMNTTFYDETFAIVFKWLSDDPEDHYKIKVTNSEGEVVNVLETQRPEALFLMQLPGVYSWQVEAFSKQKKSRALSEKRRFTLAKEVYKMPLLKFPVRPEHHLSAQRPFEFIWQFDERISFIDLILKKRDSSGWSLFREYNNLEEKSGLSMPEGLPPGRYQWTLKQKQFHDSQGLSSEPAYFSIYGNAISKYDLRFGLSVSQAQMQKTYRTARVLPAPEYDLKENVLLNKVYIGFIFTDWLGLGGKALFHPSAENPWTKRFYQSDADLYIYGGRKNFSSLTAVGYREMVLYDNYPNPIGLPFVTTGYHFSNLFSVAFADDYKLDFYIGYFRPLWIKEGAGAIDADTFEVSLGFGYMIYPKLWITLESRYNKTAVRFQSKFAGGANSWWTMHRIEPITLGLSYVY